MIEDRDIGLVYYDEDTIKRKKTSATVTGYRIGHGTKIWCTPSVLKELRNNPLIADTYKLNVLTDGDGYSVYFQDKSRVEIITMDGKEYERYY